MSLPPDHSPSAKPKLTWPPLALLGALLGLCAWHGARTVAGLGLPPEIDALRDIGFAQGLLDGNWTGDPTYADAARYYPPLVPALYALLFRLTGAADLPGLVVQAAPWLNLLSPLAYCVMARRILGSLPAAVAATAVLVLLQGLRVPYMITGGYTPWPAAPVLGQAICFAVIGLIHARVAAARWGDAVLLGALAGVAGLAHLVPAAVLSAILAAAALVAQGARPRTFGWLVLAAAAELAVLSPYALPILLRHPDGMLNRAGADYVAYEMLPLLRPLAQLAAVNAPGLLALAVLWRWRREMPLPPLSRAILAAWILVPALFLLRHYACGAVDGAAACRAFAVPVHHYHLYLNTAWPCLIGFVAWHLVRRGDRAAAVAAALLLGLGAVALATRPFDARLRRGALALPPKTVMDLPAYRWILARTAPDAVFAVPSAEGDGLMFETGLDGVALGGPEAFTVIAAGRQLLAAPGHFSNPFVNWQARDAQRQRALALLDGTATGDCAGIPPGLLLMVPRGAAAR